MAGPRPEYDTPRVWRYYLVYAVFMAVLFLSTTGIGVWLMYLSSEGPRPDTSGVGLGALVTVVGGVLAGCYCSAPFVVRPRWSWAFHTTLIVVGMLSGLGLLFGIPLLIYWFRADARALFDSGELEQLAA